MSAFSWSFCVNFLSHFRDSKHFNTMNISINTARLAALSLSAAEVGCEALSFDSRVHPDTMRCSKFVWAFDRSV